MEDDETLDSLELELLLLLVEIELLESDDCDDRELLLCEELLDELLLVLMLEAELWLLVELLDWLDSDESLLPLDDDRLLAELLSLEELLLSSSTEMIRNPSSLPGPGYSKLLVTKCSCRSRPVLPSAVWSCNRTIQCRFSSK